MTDDEIYTEFINKILDEEIDLDDEIEEFINEYFYELL